MSGLAYLAALLASAACLLVVDRRFRLFYWKDARAAAIVTVVGVLGLLLTDAAGIALHIFYRGDSEVATGVALAPQFALEEPIFLWFLVLCTMVLYTGAVRLIAARRRP